MVLTSSNVEAAQEADVIVLGVKPWGIESVCQELKSIIHHKKPLIVSLAAGIKTAKIVCSCEKENLPIVRAMPNIASAVGAGMTGLFANAFVTQAQKNLVETIFRSTGAVCWVDDEAQLDDVTVVSGSGPAYFFYLFEAMQATAESLGLSSTQARMLVIETAVGAAKMGLERQESFAQLRRLVTSEKGVTAAATAVFDQHQLKTIVDEAMKAALVRAKELAQ